MFHIIIQKNDQITKSTVELIGDNIIHIVVQTKQKTYPELQIVNPTFQNEKIKFGELDDVVMILMQFKIILALFRFIKSSKIPIPIPIPRAGSIVQMASPLIRGYQARARYLRIRPLVVLRSNILKVVSV
mgnify:CR=1 FL=1